jgi:energy-coupling factor transporter ATP-binding protein EcfA2
VQCGQAGVVFQDFALLDELSPAGNVEFATLSNPKTKSTRSAEDWLNELHVPLNVPTSRLSGGQRQRLAIARTLAANPQVILYDEPTSGLDPSTGDRVAKLIRDTHDQYQKTSIVVTHDYPTVLPIADRVFLFDAAALQIVEVPRDEWPELAQRLNRAAQSRESSPLELSKEPWSQRWVRWGAHFFSKTTDSALAGLQGLVSILPLWRNPKWGFRFLLHYANLVTGPTAMLYLFMAGMINGFVSTYFTFQFFPFATYTEPLLIEDLLQAIGFILYRVFVPILACILIAARCGAAVTADVGGRQYGSQLDAMLTFNAPPRQYLLTPIMLSFLIGTPLLNFVSYFGAVTASLFSFVWSHPDRGPDFWSHHFYWKLEAYNSWIFYGFPWLVSKLLCSAVGIGCIAYFQGRSPKYSTSDVSRSVTNTILWGTLYVLAVHFAFALYEFESLRPQRIVE